MHQTFYIDIDEEISSVIDRLNKSMAADNYFVVPPRAIFLQSIVNLKLLKREAEKSGKKVVLVTQDEIGTSMAHRSGIDVRANLEGLESAADVYLENAKEEQSEELPAKNFQDKQERLKSIGSKDFYDSSLDVQKEEPAVKVTKAGSRKIPVNFIGSASNARKGGIRETQPAHYREEISRTRTREKIQTMRSANLPSRMPDRNPSQENNLGGRQTDDHREKALEKMFSSSRSPQKDILEKSRKGEPKTMKIFLGFIALCSLALIGVAAFLFLPKAEVIIIPNILKNKIDMDVHGAGDIQADSSNIRTRTFDGEAEITLSYDVTGQGAASGKKAHGSVVIYNEFSSASQSLVATTRLESADGKIFRLAKSIVVPGTAMVGGSAQPGAIEAEVVADQAGSDYNIEPTTFKIPGFSGGPKFDKFYAKSTIAMAGGSSGDEGAAKVVNQRDIDSAKEKTEIALRGKIDELIKKELSAGETFLPQTEKIAITKSGASVKIGDMVESFNYTAQASVRAIIFSEDDIRKILQKAADNEQDNQDARKDISKVEYGNIEANFDDSTVNLQIHGEVTIVPDINSEQIIKELLGKNSDQLEDVFRKYPSIKNVNIEFWPTFISRVPQYSRRVFVEVAAED